MANNFCEQCGAQLAPDAHFCEACGHAVVSQQHDSYPPQIQQPISQPTPQTSSQSTQPSRKGKYILIGAAAIIVFVVLFILILKPGQWINRLKETAPGIITSLLSQLESTTATQDKKQSPAVDSASSTSSEPIFHVGTDRDVFYCVSSDGPTTLTIKANTDPSVPVLAFRWRLNTKKDGQVTDWEGDYLEKDSSTQFSYTLNADVWGGPNNFNYPPLLGESWFEFQIFLPDGSYQTKIYKEVTFFPCAQ